MGLLSGIGDAVGGLFGGGNDTVETKNEPWSELQPYLLGNDGNTGLYPEAQRLYQSGGSFNPLETQGQQGLLNYASGGLSDFIDTTGGAYNRMLDGSLLDVNSNPYLRGNIDAFADSVNDNLMLTDMRSNRQGAQSAGQYGSSRHGIADGLAKSRAADTIARYSSQMMNNAYNTGLNSMSGAMSMAPQFANMGMMPYQVQQSVGNQRRMLPWENLGRYQGVLTGNYMGSGGTATEPVTGASPLGSALGGAAMGSTLGPWGTAAGGVLGLMGGL